MNEDVKKLHEEFCRITGQNLTLSYQREWAWSELVKRGYGPADLALLVRWVKAQMSRHGSGYSPSSLQFNVLISDPDKFEDRLNLARKAFPKRTVEKAAVTSKSPEEPMATDEDRNAFVEQLQHMRRQ